MRTFTQSTEKLTEDLRTIGRDAEEVIKSLPNEINGKVGAARERLMGALESARESCADLREKTSDSARNVDSKAHEKPYGFIAGAFAVGVLAGVLVTRK